MLTMGSKPRQFDSSTGVRWGLLCSAFMVFCGLINIFVLTASTLKNVLYFGLAAFGLLVAAEFKVGVAQGSWSVQQLATPHGPSE